MVYGPHLMLDLVLKVEEPHRRGLAGGTARQREPARQEPVREHTGQEASDNLNWGGYCGLASVAMAS